MAEPSFIFPSTAHEQAYCSRLNIQDGEEHPLHDMHAHNDFFGPIACQVFQPEKTQLDKDNNELLVKIRELDQYHQQEDKEITDIIADPIEEFADELMNSSYRSFQVETSNDGTVSRMAVLGITLSDGKTPVSYAQVDPIEDNADELYQLYYYMKSSPSPSIDKRKLFLIMFHTVKGIKVEWFPQPAGRAKKYDTERKFGNIVSYALSKTKDFFLASSDQVINGSPFHHEPAVSDGVENSFAMVPYGETVEQHHPYQGDFLDTDDEEIPSSGSGMDDDNQGFQTNLCPAVPSLSPPWAPGIACYALHSTDPLQGVMTLTHMNIEEVDD
jgi:hypothetical protein